MAVAAFRYHRPLFFLGRQLHHTDNRIARLVIQSPWWTSTRPWLRSFMLCCRFSIKPVPLPANSPSSRLPLHSHHLPDTLPPSFPGLQCNNRFAETPPLLSLDPHNAPRLWVQALAATTRLALQEHGWSLATTHTQLPRLKGILKGRRRGCSDAKYAKDPRELPPSS